MLIEQTFAVKVPVQTLWDFLFDIPRAIIDACIPWERRQDFTTGSTAAVMGGVTTVLDMPNTKPITSTPEVVTMREGLIAEKSYCDIVLVGVVVQENVDQIKPMAEAGVVGFKIFLGTVDMIATDHSPHTPEEKLNPDIWKAASGFTGVETVMPLMLSEGVNKRGMSLNHFVKICSENPAKVWDVWPRKGSLHVGTDGDLTIVDLNKEWTIDETKLHSKNNVTPWHGWSGKGKPVMTIVRGQVVMKDGEFVADKPRGQMVRPLK